MNQLKAYWQLLRLHKPIGILLLWYPTAWALWVANQGPPSMHLGILFFLGTVLMRSAGCVVNDIIDRNVDKHVARTKMRPLTSGSVGLLEAFILLFLLLSCSLWILLNLDSKCYYLALIAVVIVMIYPFCKRFFKAPQLILGLAFSMGIPMAFVASGMSVNSAAMLLFLINFIWIVAYDTMYAMTDKEDDLKIGVQSTAIYFSSLDRYFVGTLLVFLHFLWIFWSLSYQTKWEFYLIWSVAALVLCYQQKLINKKIPRECFKAFLISNYYGALMWFAVIRVTS